ncbi:MAG: energy transducer TonB [Flexibacteraceae bacterium]
MLDYQSNKVSLEDIIFEYRNKAYGAYELRTKYQKRSILASFWAIVILFLILVGPVVIGKIQDALSKTEEVEEISVETKLAPPPPLDPNTPPPPPPPPASAAPPPPKVSTVRFLPPEVAKDEEVKEEIIKNDELKDAVASTETVQGDPNADPNEVVVEGTPGGTGTVVEAPVEEEILSVVEEMPEFPGGQEKMIAFLAKSIKYPQQAIRSEKQGRVYVQFIVGSNGELTGFEVVRGVGFGLDEEALRASKLMPNWKPGKQGGRAVKVKCVIPVEFKLEGGN